MRVLWVTTVVLVAMAITPSNADPKKYDPKLHLVKKALAEPKEPVPVEVQSTPTVFEPKVQKVAVAPNVSYAEAKSVPAATQYSQQANNDHLTPEQKAGIGLPGFPLVGFPPLGGGGLGGIPIIGFPAGVTTDGTAVGIGLGPFLAALFGGLPGFPGPGFPGLPGLPGLDVLTAIATAIFATLAGLGAVLAGLIGFAVKGLQIANQVLAIIGIALLIAYLVEKKKGEEEEYYYEEDTGYGEYDSGYASEGYGAPVETSGYGDSIGYSSDNSAHTAHSGPAATGTSSYSSYRRADEAPNPDGTISRASKPIVNRVARMVNSAVKKYSEMYSE